MDGPIACCHDRVPTQASVDFKEPENTRPFEKSADNLRPFTACPEAEYGGGHSEVCSDSSSETQLPKLVAVVGPDCAGVISAQIDARRLLLWTLLVGTLWYWGQRPMEILSELVAFGLAYTLAKYRFCLSSPAVTSFLLYVITIVLIVSVTVLTSLPAYKNLEFVMKKMVIREYMISYNWTPRMYVAVLCITVVSLVVHNPFHLGKRLCGRRLSST